MEYIENKQIYKYYGHGALSNIKTVHTTMFNFRKLRNIQLTEYEKKKKLQILTCEGCSFL